MDDNIQDVPPIELTKMVRFSTAMGMLRAAQLVVSQLVQEIDLEAHRESGCEEIFDGVEEMEWAIEILPDPHGDYVRFSSEDDLQGVALKLANAISERSARLDVEFE